MTLIKFKDYITEKIKFHVNKQPVSRPFWCNQGSLFIYQSMESLYPNPVLFHKLECWWKFRVLSSIPQPLAYYKKIFPRPNNYIEK